MLIRKNILIYLVGAIILTGLFVLVRHKEKERTIQDIYIVIERKSEDYFINKEDVLKMIVESNSMYVIGMPIEEFNTKHVESFLESSAYIKKAQLYKEISGNINVVIQQMKPIARLLRKKQEDLYIDEDGYLIPVSINQTARVPILELEKTSAFGNSLLEDEYGRKIFNLLNFIENHSFWVTQIAHIYADRQGELLIYPQVTKQSIQFGFPEDIEMKFQKLWTFYQEILPAKGWNTYSSVNLKFKNQIICII